MKTSQIHLKLKNENRAEMALKSFNNGKDIKLRVLDRLSVHADTPMQESAEFHHPISDIIKKRKSGRSFSDRMIEPEKINSLFEAARWAPSSGNGQPWFYLYALKSQPDLWRKFFDCLNERSRIWAGAAPLLIISLARKVVIKNGTPNPYAYYDLGAANAFLSLQAVEFGLQLRQMGTYNYAKAKEIMKISDIFALGTMIAVGYPGDPETLPEDFKQNELAPRKRILQNEFVMNSVFHSQFE